MPRRVRQAKRSAGRALAARVLATGRRRRLDVLVDRRWHVRSGSGNRNGIGREAACEREADTAPRESPDGCGSVPCGHGRSVASERHGIAGTVRRGTLLSRGDTRLTVTLVRPEGRLPETSRPPNEARWPGRALTLAIAAGIFWLAYDNGTYSVQSRSAAAIAVWWVVLLAVVFGFWPARRLGFEAAAAGLGLAGFGVLAVASTQWAPNADTAFQDANRDVLYLGVFFLVLIAGYRGSLERWCDGIAGGITAIVLLALFARCFPQVINTTSAFRFLPSAQYRLNYPVGYWNGLSVLTAIGIPLLFRAALAGPSLVKRALPVAPLPAFIAALYLSSSRTGVVVACLGVFSLFALSPRRWATLGVLAVAGTAGALAIAVLLRRDTLVNGPLTTAAARHEGWTAAVLLAAACVAAGAAYAVLVRVSATRRTPGPRAERTVLAAGALAVLVGIALANPVDLFHKFRQSPSTRNASASGDYIQSHLLSAWGNGRWQFWETAGRQFKDHPLLGGGSGSYQTWWERHRTYGAFVRDAHSLYVEVLGELGVIGLGLVVVFILAGMVAAARRLAAGDDQNRLTVGALASAFLAFAVAAGVDWMWELPAVGAVGIVLLALLVGPASAGSIAERWPSWKPLAAGVAVVAIALPVIGSQAIAMVGDLKLGASQAAVARGDAEGAVRDAADAANVEPWSPKPYLQLALVSEELGNVRNGRSWIEKAIRRDPDDWSLWVVRARLETKAGAIEAARSSLARARTLNPLSPLWSSLAGGRG